MHRGYFPIRFGAAKPEQVRLLWKVCISCPSCHCSMLLPFWSRS